MLLVTRFIFNVHQPPSERYLEITMPHSTRPISYPDDLPLLSRLVHQSPASHPHVVDLPYRLASWAFDDPRNGRLWFDSSGGLAAWAVLQTPFWMLDFAVAPGSQCLPEVLAWAEATAAELAQEPEGHACWFAAVLETQPETIRALQQAGWADISSDPESPWSQVLLKLAEDAAPPAPTLPDGFTLRPLAGAGEVGAYVDLHRRVFESRNMTPAWRLRTLQRPEYRPEMDLVIESPEGRLAAFCVGWYDPAGPGGLPAAQVEPMGVDEAFRGLGLGSAILNEQIRRMRALGARQIFVETDDDRGPALALYHAAGFQNLHRIPIFRKDAG